MLRKPISVWFILLFLCSSLIPMVSSDIPNSKSIIYGYNDEIINSNQNMKWTWMFYDDADFYQAYDPLNDFAKEAFSSENINVLVLQDPNDGPAKIWYIDEDHNKEILMNLGEVNMGDSNTLRDFINYSKKNFQADRYLLSLYDHGGGWMGACVDNTDNGWLTMNDMQKALIETGGVDVICFTAPCLMGSLESAYELKDCTDIYIASEETSGYIIWRDAIGDICVLLNDNPVITNIEIGEKIILILKDNKIYEDYPKWVSLNSNLHVTISAIRTDLLENLVENVDRLALKLIEKMNNNSASYAKIRVLLLLTKSFGTIIRFRNTEILDLYDFSKKCSKIFGSDESIKTHAKSVLDSIEEVVIANYRGIKQLRANGLTIYFPNEYYNSDYEKTLDFTNITHWDEFIKEYISGKDNSIESDLDQSQTDSGTAAVVCGNWMWAQSFIPSSSSLKKIRIPLLKRGIIFTNVKVSIRQNLLEDDLASVSKLFYQIPRNNYKWIEFDFDDIQVVPGEIYYMVCYTEGGDNQINMYSWMSSLTDVYENGDAWIGWNKGINWEIWEYPSDNPSRFDFCFKTYF